MLFFCTNHPSNGFYLSDYYPNRHLNPPISGSLVPLYHKNLSCYHVRRSPDIVHGFSNGSRRNNQRIPEESSALLRRRSVADSASVENVQLEISEAGAARRLQRGGIL